MQLTKNFKIGEGLAFLRPGAEWFLSGDDYSNLKWLDKKQTPPTIEEIEEFVAQYDAWKAEQDAARAAEKQALLAKLGITEDEAKLLLS